MFRSNDTAAGGRPTPLAGDQAGSGCRRFRPPAVVLLVLGALIGLLFLADAQAQPADSDGDGWSDEYEMYLPTGPNRACPLHLGDAAWPPDLNNDTFVDIFDLVQLAGDFALPIGAPNVAHREDIAPEPGGDQFVDIFDIVKAANLAFTGCTP